MKYVIEIPNCDIFQETDHFCTTAEEVVNELENDFFVQDTLREMMDCCSVGDGVSGYYDEDMMTKALCEDMSRQILKLDKWLIAKSRQTSDTGEVIEERTISLSDIIREEWDWNTGDYLTDRICHCIESDLLELVEDAQWFIGVQHKLDGTIEPLTDGMSLDEHDKELIIWYYREGETPVSPWIIREDTADLSFWFEVNVWEFFQHLSNLDSGTLLWYSEYDCAIPDMDDVLDTCPVTIWDTDTGKEVIEKVKIG